MNVPDILEESVTPVLTPNEDFPTLSQISLTLADPYELTGSPVYVGYTLTVDDVETDELKYPLILSPGIEQDGLYLHMSKSVLKWMNYSENIGGVAAIYVTLEGDFPASSLGVKGVDRAFAEDGKDFFIFTSVTNMGSDEAKSIDYTIAVDGGEAVEYHLDLESPVVPDIVHSTKIELPVNGIDGLGNHDVDLTITKVNGIANETASPSCSFVVEIYPFVPVTRPVVEEFTGTWCGWCTRGYLAMELLNEKYGDNIVAIAYHSGDQMEVTSTFPVYVSGYPAASLNRAPCVDPYYGSSNEEIFGLSLEVEALTKILAPADISVNAVWNDEEKNAIDIESTSKFIQSYEEANYKVGYVLVANGLSSPTWLQNNSYAGKTEMVAGTPLEELATWPSTVPNLKFNDVAIDVKGMMGVAESIPANIEVNEAITHNYSIDITGNALVQNKDNLVVMALLIDGKTGRIVNSAKSKINVAQSVNGVEIEKSVVAEDYYDLNGVKVTNPSNGIYVKVIRHSDGSIKTNKTVINN